MKVTYVFLILYSFFYIISSEYCESLLEINVNKASTCHKRQTSKEGSYCCFIKLKEKIAGVTFTTQSCEELTKAEYDNIKDYKKKYEKDCASENCSVKKIDCRSSYLTFSLLSLILLIFEAM